MKASWRSPSNIALVKYWGKHGLQLPKNPSISFTLKNAFSDISIELCPKTNNELPEFDIYFENKLNESFRPKISKFLSLVQKDFEFIHKNKLVIRSSNSFPHSAGIASSASSMSAMALCLMELKYKSEGRDGFDDNFFHQSSYYARLGSGSACRSVFPGLAVWGRAETIGDSSDEYAIGFKNEVNPVFHTFRNDILIVSSAKKSVSSSQGHNLMNDNPFADLRYSQANINLADLTESMKKGDLQKFGEIVEQEALQLHALMMTSKPSFLLMEGQSVEIIKRIRKWRNETGHPLFFSMDAGPNMHIMYPEEIAVQAKRFITDELMPFCENNLILEDAVGEGPMCLSYSEKLV